MLSSVITVLSSGQIIAKVGYYWPFLAAAPFFLALGSGLLYTLTDASPLGHIIGFQILAGIGIGMGMQNALLSLQVEFRAAPRMLAQANAMGSFAQFLGGTLGLGVAEPVFASQLTRNLRRYAPDAPVALVKESPTAIYGELPAQIIAGVVRSYAEALRVVFVLGVPVAGLAFLAVFFIMNLRIMRSVPAMATPPLVEDSEHVSSKPEV